MDFIAVIRRRPGWAPHGLTLVSAALLVASFPPWDLWPLIWIGLIPWFYVLKRTRTFKEALLQGLWLNYFLTLGGFYWIAYSIQEFGNLPWSLSVLGLLVFCLIGQPQFVLFAPLWKGAHQRGSRFAPHLLLPLFLSLFYVGLDWILPKLFVDSLGNSLYRAKYLRQLADLGGVSALTFLIFFVNDGIWRCFEGFFKNRNPIHFKKLILPVALLSLSWTYGYFRHSQITQIISNTDRSFQAAAIQANIGDFDKIAAERGTRGAAEKVIDTYTDLSQQALNLTPRPHFLIWPETSYPSTFKTPHTPSELRMDERIENFVRDIKVPLLFGGYDHFNQKDFNAFFFLSHLGSLQTYRKSILLLFGEYIPGAETFQFIKDAFPQVGNFGRGNGPEAFEIQISQPNLSKVFAGPMICYEGLFSHFAIESAKRGSQFLLNITNDSWFGQWGEPQLHLALTSFRAIETRLPMIRSTNTGISTLILPDGEITSPTQLFHPEILNVRVPITDPIPTLIKLWGDWFGIFALFCGGLGLAWHRFSKEVDEPGLF